MAIPESVIEQVRDRADIVEIISGYITLKKAGSNFKALCPFHHEKTSSFMVSPQKQIFHCFGCGEGGNVFSFLMKQERMTFPETVEFLAERLGITIPQPPLLGFAKQSRGGGQEIYEVNSLAASYYHDFLIRSPVDAPVQQYLRKRGVSAEIIKKFQLGFSPDQWEGLIAFAKSNGVSTAALARGGLVLQREGGGYYDRFRNRLMFPIFDLRDRVVGFGGRVLTEEGTPKYLNSPETEIYQKGRQLYGLSWVKESIKEKDAVLLVEGYMDLIALYQAGIEFVVASCGTALTVEQIRVLKRFTHRVIVVYDGDQAGQMASLRGLDLLLEEGCQVRLMDLPQGKDPDDFVRHEGAGAFRQKMQQAKDLLEYKLGLLLREKDIRDPHQKAQVAKEMLATIRRLPSPVLRGEYLKQLAEKIHVREENLWSELNQFPGMRTEEVKPVKNQPPRISLAEKLLLRLVFEQPDFLQTIQRELRAEDFENEQVRSLMKNVFDGSLDPRQMNQWLSGLEDLESARFFSGVLSDEEAVIEPEKSLKDCVRWLKQNRYRKQLGKLQQEIASAETDQTDQLDRLLTEYQQVLKIHQQQSPWLPSASPASPRLGRPRGERPEARR